MQQNTFKIFTPLFFSGCLILLTGFAIRSRFGIFQIPIADQFNWLRTEFSMAIACIPVGTPGAMLSKEYPESGIE